MGSRTTGPQKQRAGGEAGLQGQRHRGQKDGGQGEVLTSDTWPVHTHDSQELGHSLLVNCLLLEGEKLKPFYFLLINFFLHYLSICC